MIQQTKGIVLRSVKYGETSLICSIFTRDHGVQSYMVQGVRTAKSRGNRAGLLQPANLLDLVVYQKTAGNLQRIKEMQPDYIYMQLQEDIVRNSIALFSVELLLRLLPEHAIMPELYDFSRMYFEHLDKMPRPLIANLPLFFVIQCSRLLGYNIQGSYSADTPYLNAEDGAFTHHPPVARPFVADDAARALNQLLHSGDYTEAAKTEMNAEMRFDLLDWFIIFLQKHTQHLHNIKSLTVLRAILH
ncbi:DNA repair protein RecO [Chitinophagaceae bacterium MMS25-I14]